MKNSLFYGIALLLVGFGYVVTRSYAANYEFAPGQPLRQDARIQWEYKELLKNGNEIATQEFDQLGDDGWEMCGVRQRGQGVSYFYFKREKLPQGQGLANVGPPTFVPKPVDSEPQTFTDGAVSIKPGYSKPVPLPPPPTELPSVLRPQVEVKKVDAK